MAETTYNTKVGSPTYWVWEKCDYGGGWTLQEHYDEAYSAAIAFHTVNWEAQTFTPATAHGCKKVSLYTHRYGDLTGVNLTVSIRNTDGSGHPTGGDLVSKTVDANSISTDYAWVEFEFATPASLLASTKYAIVWRIDGGDGTHYIETRCQSGNPYAGGNVERSSNSGDSWTALTTYDYNFREYELVGAEKCPVGAEPSWAWQVPTSGGPNKTPQGGPTSFSWASE